MFADRLDRGLCSGTSVREYCGQTWGARRDRGCGHEGTGERAGEEGGDRTHRREPGGGRRLHSGQRSRWRVSDRRDCAWALPSLRRTHGNARSRQTSSARGWAGSDYGCGAGTERSANSVAGGRRGPGTRDRRRWGSSAQRAGDGAAADVCFRAQPGAERTNDLGEYRVAGLPAGSYYLSVSPPPDFKSLIEAAGVAAADARNTGAPDKPATSYQTTYYPGTADRSQASPVELHAGDEFPLNFSLTPS